MLRDGSDRLFWGITAGVTVLTALGIYVFACGIPAPSPRAAAGSLEQATERPTPRARSAFSR